MASLNSGQLSAREIFTAARAIADSKQCEEYLNDQCGQDLLLRKKVAGLLAAAWKDADVDRLDVMVDAFGADETVAYVPDRQVANDLTQLREIGHYKLLEQIGQGGFGTVYMAEQTAPVRRKVAVKILKPGMDSSEVIARFEAERQALAMMDHPNISRVIDGGTTETGRPYFVMELVRGIPVTEYCDEARLTTEERLELFIDICKAVQHAHQKGIIHRDLKPSNVLVTMHDDKAVPKVIDFGIAKALNQQLTDRTLFTGYQQLLGTPLYMSPEQAQMSGIDIDTRSDVYSLGVMLYELLTGTPPFDKESLSKASFDDLRRIIREQEPPRPSARVTTLNAQARTTMADRRRVDRRCVSDELRGELDWIVMKALEKDRNRRYESVSAMAADLRRYLCDEPVQACPPALWYRVQKFSRKNRIWLTTSAVCAVMLVAASGVSVVYAVQAQMAKQHAQEQREDAIAARKESEKRLQQSRVDFDRALSSLDAIVSEASSVKFAQLPGVEAVRADILLKAMTFYDEIIADHDDDPYARARRAVALHTIAKIHEANGEPRRFLEELNKAIVEMESVLNECPDENRYRASMVDMLFSRMHMGHQAFGICVTDAKQCLELTRQIENSGTPVHPPWMGLLTYKVAEMMRNDSAEAEHFVRESMRVTSEAGIDPVPGAVIWLATQHASAGRKEDAVNRYTEGIALLDRRAKDPFNPSQHIERCIASTERSALAEVLESMKKFEESETLFRRAFNDSVVLAQEYRTMDWYHQMLYFRSVELLEFLNRRSRLAEATSVIEQLEQSFASSKTLHMIKATWAELSGDAEGARGNFETAASIDRSDSTIPRHFAALLMRQKERVAAIREFQKSIAIEPGQWWIYKQLARMHFDEERFDDVIDDLRNAIVINPQDLSTMTSLDLEKIASLTSSDFQRSYLELANKAVELNQNSWQSLIMRSMVSTVVGDGLQGRVDLRVLVATDLNDLYLMCEAALLSARLREDSFYSGFCQKSYDRFAGDADSEERHIIVWTAVLAPHGFADYRGLRELAPKIESLGVESLGDLVDLGALEFRSGNFAAARTYLRNAIQKQVETDEQESQLCYAKYFLAMTEHDLNDAVEANLQLESANRLAKQVFAKSPKWNRAMTIRLLQDEVNRHLNAVQ